MRLSGREGGRARRCADASPSRRPLDRLAANDREPGARPRARSGRRPRGDQWGHVPHAAVAEDPAARDGAPHPPRPPLHGGARTAGHAGRDDARDGAASLALQARAVRRGLGGDAPGARRARRSPRVDRDQLQRRRRERLRARRQGRPPEHRLPRPAQALQARGAAPADRRGGAGPRGGDRRRRRRSRGDRGGDRRARPRGEGAPARLCQRAAQGRAVPARLGACHGVGQGGLVAHRDGGGRVRHTQHRARGGRAARIDRRRRDRPTGDRPRRPRGPDDSTGGGRAPPRAPGRRRACPGAGVLVGANRRAHADAARGRSLAGGRRAGAGRRGGRGHGLGDRPRRGPGGGGHGRECDRARRHRRIRSPAGSRRLRVARRPSGDVPDPVGARSGATRRVSPAT